MKTRNLLLGAFGLLLMASCTKDEVMDINRDGDEIAFNVVANANTRVYTDTNNGSGGVYCNLNLPQEFYVWAMTADDDKTTYIEGDKVQKYVNTSATNAVTGTRMTYNAALASYKNTCLRYWPGDRPLDFYAAAHAVAGDPNYDFKWNDTEKDDAGNILPPKIEVTIPALVKDQKDLLYAVKKNQSKETASGYEDRLEPTGRTSGGTSGGSNPSQVGYGSATLKTVNLNFRHALSQVVFTAQNPNEQLYVRVDGVSICNVQGKGTFTYPSVDTDPNKDGHPLSTPTTTPEYKGIGTWAYPTTPEKTTYKIDFAAQMEIPAKIVSENSAGEEVIEEDPVISLSGPLYEYQYKDENGEPLMGNDGKPKKFVHEYNTNAMLLLPQTSVAWNPNAGENEPAKTGSYAIVKCFIGNIAKKGDKFKPGEDVTVWGSVENTAAEGEPVWEYTTKELAIPVALNWEQGKKYIYNIVFGLTDGFDPLHPDDDLVSIAFKLTVDEFDGTYSNTANTNIITVTDSMLEELVNMKR